MMRNAVPQQTLSCEDFQTGCLRCGHLEMKDQYSSLAEVANTFCLKLLYNNFNVKILLSSILRYFYLRLMCKDN